MTIGDRVRATYPYGGVPSCDGIIIDEQILGGNTTQFLVSFEVRPKSYKKFHLTARELTLCSKLDPEPEQPSADAEPPEPEQPEPEPEQPELRMV